MDQVKKFCNIIRKRSKEHTKAMSRVHGLPGMMVSILRQELDSMVRTIYLLSVDNIDERNRLIAQTLNGEVWTVTTPKGKKKKVTDREMVKLSNDLHGWTLSVYKFGCAFIHFSNFHDYNECNPFEALNQEEQADILKHLRNYHGGPQTDTPSFDQISMYCPNVLKKITGNLECYVKDIELNEMPLDL